MSSLAAAQADGFYFPPEYLDNEVNKKMGLSKYQGSKGANQYQQRGVIRFELPFDAWCLKCERHMSKGLRFNAKKDKCGNYFSTVIFSFTTKCPSCDNRIVIKTDPKNNTYDYAEGIRKHEQDFEPEFGDGIIESTSTETKKKLEEDPIYKLQHDKEDKERALSAKNRITNLIELSDLVNRSDYDHNSALRQFNRNQRKRNKELTEEGAQFGLSIPLVEPTADDSIAAKRAKFRSTAGSNSGFAISHRLKQVDIKTQSIFKDESKSRKSNAVTSSAFRQSEKEKQAMMKQAIHKISMKDVKLGNQDFNSSVKLSLLPQSSVVTKKKRKTDAKRRTNSKDCNGMQIKSKSSDTNSALSILGGLYDSDNSD